MMNSTIIGPLGCIVLFCVHKTLRIRMGGKEHFPGVEKMYGVRGSVASNWGKAVEVNMIYRSCEDITHYNSEIAIWATVNLKKWMNLG